MNIKTKRFSNETNNPDPRHGSMPNKQDQQAFSSWGSRDHSYLRQNNIQKRKEQFDISKMAKFQLLTSNMQRNGKQQKIGYFLRIWMAEEQRLFSSAIFTYISLEKF